MAWGKRQNLVNRAIVEGDLDVAAEHLKQDRARQSLSKRRIQRRLTAALLQRAEQAISLGNLALAWKDLSTATDIASSSDSDLISRQKNQLVEMTIESADSLLMAGKITHAVQLIDQLGKRQIMDWRADRILNVSRHLQQADKLAAIGKFDDSINQLQAAHNLLPELPFIELRLVAARQRKTQIEKLNADLKSAALKCQWGEVSQCCQKILAIAPKHEIALGAQRHCAARMQRKTSAGLRATQIPDRMRITDSNSFFQVSDKTGSSNTAESGALAKDRVASDDSFLLWVDGVGGYLVCTGKVNTMGQAVAQASISIPIQGDLRRRHARLETVGGQHLLQPLGSVLVDGELIESPVEVKHQQTIGFDGGVKLKYTQSHPLSKTARLDFVSRHRTQPWSDAVLLASQSIILGPNRDNHVYCPMWRFDLMLFERNGKWFCRTNESFEIDDQTVDKEGGIQFDSRIVGEDFSLTLERVV